MVPDKPKYVLPMLPLHVGSAGRGCKREPTATLAASKHEPAAIAVALKGESTATTPAKPPFQIKCEIGLASCRKWIALAGAADAAARAQRPIVVMPLIPW